MSRDLRLVLYIDGDPFVLDHAELEDDQAVTARGVARGLNAVVERIDIWQATKDDFDDIITRAS